MLPLVFFRRDKLRKSTIGLGLGLGVPLFLGFLFQTYGLVYTSATNSAFLTGLLVIMVPLMNSLYLRKWMPAKFVVGVLLSLTGLYFLAGPLRFPMNQGDVLSLVCAFMYSVHILWLSILDDSHDVFILTFIQLVVVMVLSGVFGFVSEDWSQVGAIPWGALLFCGVFATCLAFIIQVQCQRWVGATRAALIFVTEPVWASLFAYVILGEILSFHGYLGAALILLGLVVVEWPKKKRRIQGA